jgi:hypothetical protein
MKLERRAAQPPAGKKRTKKVKALGHFSLSVDQCVESFRENAEEVKLLLNTIATGSKATSAMVFVWNNLETLVNPMNRIDLRSEAESHCALPKKLFQQDRLFLSGWEIN